MDRGTMYKGEKERDGVKFRRNEEVSKKRGELSNGKFLRDWLE